MRTIIRNNYDPHIGDYHERIIQDEAREKTWLFDCDGVYLDITAGRGDTKVVNELGDSETDATSQKLVTDELAKKQDTLVAGDNITIEGNVISAGGGNYTAGYGLTLTGTEFAANTSVLATQTDLVRKQDTLTTAQLAAVNSGIDSTKVGQIATNATDIDTIEGKIPAQATSSNQLADKDFVNSSVATNTANFVGTFNTIEELEAVQDPTNNDYGFVIGTDSAGNTVYNRYKFNGTAWVFEYALNNSSFTAEQWAAIQSGITAGLVTKLNNIEAGAEVNTIDSISVNGTAVTPDANKNADILIPDGVLLLDVDNHTLTADELQAFKDAWDSQEPIFIHYGAVGGQIVHPQIGNTLDWTQRQTFSAIMGLRNSSSAIDQPTFQSGVVTFTPSTMKINFSWNNNSSLPMEGESSLSTAANGNAWVKKSAIRTALALKQDTLTFDPTPTQNSTNPVTSGGVFEALAGAGGIKTLTTADYNYPANNPTMIDGNALADGFYVAGELIRVRKDVANAFDNYAAGGVLIKSGGSFLKHISGAARWQFQTSFYNYSAYSLLDVSNVVDNLTSTSTADPLSANQGRVLKDLIDSIAVRGAGAPTTSTVGTVGQLYEDGTNGDLYQLKSIDITVTPNTYNWEEVGGSSVNVVQTPGTSTTDVMSQNAVTGMVFADPAARHKVQIGTGSNASGSFAIALSGGVANGNRSVAIKGQAANAGAIAIGAGSLAISQGEMNIGSSNTPYGYNNSNYRLLSGVYDGQSAHDAATVAQGNTLATTAPTASTVGVLGQLYTDTTNMHTYQCTAIDTTDPQNPSYTWTQRW